MKAISFSRFDGDALAFSNSFNASASHWLSTSTTDDRNLTLSFDGKRTATASAVDASLF
jgi:hypothetical protein